MIYVSTGGESAQTAYKTSCEFLKFGIANIELSGGLYDEDSSNNIILLEDAAQAIHSY